MTMGGRGLLMKGCNNWSSFMLYFFLADPAKPGAAI